MRGYLAEGLLPEREGAIYVERSLGHHLRRGLMLELDLEHYDFSSRSTSLIRPTEGTIVARLAPRIEVRRGRGTRAAAHPGADQQPGPYGDRTHRRCSEDADEAI